MTTSDPFDFAGKVLDGRYRLDAVVGEGGFGVVYRGYHLGLDSPIAVKVLKIPNDPRVNRAAFIAAFRAEGRHLLELSGRHTSFVRALDAGVFDAAGGAIAPYLVLEWLNGETLEADLERRRKAGMRGRTVAEVLAVLEPVAQALSLAHELGIAHRDIKPANIFLAETPDGRSAKVLDFGVAKVLTETGTAALRQTAGMDGAMFSAAYGAPEQWARKKYGATGPWTDVYAFALVCVEMLTEAAPLPGENQHEWMAATLDAERPTPKARGARVSEAVEEVFRRAFAMQVKDRTPSLRAFWSELAAAAQVGGRGATLVGPTVVVPGPAPSVRTEPMQGPAEPVVAIPERRPEVVKDGGKPSKRTPLIAGGVLAGLAALVAVVLAAGGPEATPDVVQKPPTAAPSVIVPPPPAPPRVTADMVRLAAGTFDMGSKTGDADERPVQEGVQVGAFEMDITEVTVDAYAACVRDGKCTEPDTGGDCNWKKDGRGKHPINCVDWDQATAYCSSANKRLPTEKEWEYAARGSAGREYPWGSAVPSDQLCWKQASGSCQVGSYAKGATPEGLLDMAGNVWEWTSDNYCPYGSNSCAEKARVFRGGSWFSTDPSNVRGAYRYWIAPSIRHNDVGFRCARAG